MRMLTIYGSPRENGNSDLLLNEFLKGVEKSTHAPTTVESVFARKLNITACRGCRACDLTGKCIVNDDMTILYSELEQADCLVVSSPIFFYGVPSQLKTLIDRTQAFWARKYLLKRPLHSRGGHLRPGIFLAVCARGRQNVFDGAKLTIRYFFDVCGFTYKQELLISGLDLKGDILSRVDDMKVAYELGKNL